MARRDRGKVIPFSRDYRRVRKFDMGFSPRKTPQPKRGKLDPRQYLVAVIVFSLALLLALPVVSDAGLALAKKAKVGDQSCRIVRVVDGDTVTLLCGAAATRARLLGFDTPELFSPRCPEEAYAALRAKWALRGALWRASEVNLIAEGQDRYERRLVRVFLDGAPLSGFMVSQGYARPYVGGARGGWC